MDSTSAREPYFFECQEPSVSVSIGIRLVFRICDFKDLSVADVGATGDAEKNENCGEYPFKSQPFIQVIPHKETKNDAAGHGQPQLHDNGQVFCPVPVFFIIEQTAVSVLIHRASFFIRHRQRVSFFHI
jgi:hypothetical protein